MLKVGNVLAFIKARPSVIEQIQARWFNDEKLRVFCDKLWSSEIKTIFLHPDGFLRIGGHVCLLKVG